VNGWMGGWVDEWMSGWVKGLRRNPENYWNLKAKSF